MRRPEAELRAQQAVELVTQRRQVEDPALELKGEWKPPDQVARQLGGHANAARVETILWLIGVDEAGGLTGAVLDRDFAIWWSQVESRFHGNAPDLIDHFTAFRGDEAFTVLQFDTRAAPFVVRSPDPGDDRLEVPWRDGTRTRSARHDELLRILVPRVLTPSFELRGARLIFGPTTRDGVDQWYLDLSISCYVEAPVDSATAIPDHRCCASVEAAGVAPIALGGVSLAGRQGSGAAPTNPMLAGLAPASRIETVHSGDEVVLITGPGRVRALASGRVSKSVLNPEQLEDVRVRFSLEAMDLDRPIVLAARMVHDHVSKRGQVEMALDPRDVGSVS